MIPTLHAGAAQELAESGLAQLVDGTWLMPGSTAQTELLANTTAVVDTAALKALPHDTRAARAHEVFAASGVLGARPVAVYDRAGFFSAPWVAWLLASHGASVSLVSGVGMEGDTRTLEGSGLVSTAEPERMNATKADVLAALGTRTQIVDVRPPERFAGSAPEPRPECRSGRIPGSLNLPFGRLKGDSAFRDYEDLAEAAATSGIDLERPVITTCGSGVTASAVAVVLQRLGATDVRVYQGSWAEWSMDPALPIETGA